MVGHVTALYDLPTLRNLFFAEIRILETVESWVLETV